jgi:hypothetical protein
MIRRGDDLRVVKTVLSGLLPHHTGRRKVLDENESEDHTSSKLSALREL